MTFEYFTVFPSDRRYSALVRQKHFIVSILRTEFANYGKK